MINCLTGYISMVNTVPHVTQQFFLALPYYYFGMTWNCYVACIHLVHCTLRV